MASIKGFIIALVIFMIFLGGAIIPLMAQFNEKYPHADYNESDLEVYNKLSEIKDDSEEIKEGATSLRSESGVLDILGGFFEAGYNTLNIAIKSIDVVGVLSSQAAEDTNLPNMEVYKSGLMVILVITLILGVVIAAVVKWRT